jgi:hypothetical protein
LKDLVSDNLNNTGIHFQKIKKESALHHKPDQADYRAFNEAIEIKQVFSDKKYQCNAMKIK